MISSKRANGKGVSIDGMKKKSYLIFSLWSSSVVTRCLSLLPLACLWHLREVNGEREEDSKNKDGLGWYFFTIHKILSIRAYGEVNVGDWTLEKKEVESNSRMLRKKNQHHHRFKMVKSSVWRLFLSLLKHTKFLLVPRLLYDDGESFLSGKNKL